MKKFEILRIITFNINQCTMLYNNDEKQYYLTNIFLEKKNLTIPNL